MGSNIFNIAAVMGASALVRSYPVDQSILTLQLPAVLILSVLVWPVVASGRRVRRSEGLLLLLVYVGLMGWITLGS